MQDKRLKKFSEFLEREEKIAGFNKKMFLSESPEDEKLNAYYISPAKWKTLNNKKALEITVPENQRKRSVNLCR